MENTLELMKEYLQTACDGIAEATEKAVNTYKLTISYKGDSYTLRNALMTVFTTNGFVCKSMPGYSEVNPSYLEISWAKGMKFGSSIEDKLFVESAEIEAVTKYSRLASLHRLIDLTNNPSLSNISFVLPIEPEDKKWEGLLRDVFRAVGYTKIETAENEAGKLYFTLSLGWSTEAKPPPLVVLTALPKGEIVIKDEEASKQTFFEIIAGANAALLETRSDAKLKKYHAFDLDEKAIQWRDVLVGVFSNKGYRYHFFNNVLPNKLRMVLEWGVEDKEEKKAETQMLKTAVALAATGERLLEKLGVRQNDSLEQTVFPRRSAEHAALAVLKYLRLAAIDALRQIERKENVHMCRFNIEAEDMEWEPVIGAVFSAKGFMFVDGLKVNEEGSMPITIVNKNEDDPVLPRLNYDLKATSEEIAESGRSFIKWVSEVSESIRDVKKDKTRASYATFDINSDDEWKEALMGLFAGLGCDCLCLNVGEMNRVVLTWEDPEVPEDVQRAMKERIAHPNGEVIRVRPPRSVVPCTQKGELTPEVIAQQTLSGAVLPTTNTQQNVPEQVIFPRRSPEHAAVAVLKYLRLAAEDARRQIERKESVHMCWFKIEENDLEWKSVIGAVFSAKGFLFVDGMKVDDEGNMPICIVNNLESSDPRYLFMHMKATVESEQFFIKTVQDIAASLLEVRHNKKLASYATFDINTENEWKEALMGIFAGLGCDCICVNVRHGIQRVILTWEDPEVPDDVQRAMKERIAHPSGEVIRIRAPRSVVHCAQKVESGPAVLKQQTVTDAVLPTSAQQKEKLVRQYISVVLSTMEQPFNPQVVRLLRTVSVDVRKCDEDILPELREIFISKGYAVEVAWQSIKAAHRFTVTW